MRAKNQCCSVRCAFPLPSFPLLTLVLAARACMLDAVVLELGVLGSKFAISRSLAFSMRSLQRSAGTCPSFPAGWSVKKS